MKKKNFVAIFFLAFALLLSPTTLYAAESSNNVADIMVRESDWIYQHIYDYGFKITIRSPYISKTFKAKTERMEILFGAGGASGTYTYYLEELNPDGTWTAINSHTIKYTGTISTTAFVTPNNTYRVRATTTDKYPISSSLEVYEIIYD